MVDGQRGAGARELANPCDSALPLHRSAPGAGQRAGLRNPGATGGIDGRPTDSPTSARGIGERSTDSVIDPLIRRATHRFLGAARRRVPAPKLVLCAPVAPPKLVLRAPKVRPGRLHFFRRDTTSQFTLAGTQRDLVRRADIPSRPQPTRHGQAAILTRLTVKSRVPGSLDGNSNGTCVRGAMNR